MFIFKQAAESVLESDRNKSPEFGGERLKGVIRVEVDGGEDAPATVTLHTKAGAASCMCLPTGIYRPKDRAFSAADVHDSVRTAMLYAYEELTA